MTRPRGTPPMPSARSSPSEPVDSAARSWCASVSSRSFMIAPLPNCFSIWLTARSMARSRFTSIPMSRPPPHPGAVEDDGVLYSPRRRGSRRSDPFLQVRSGHRARERQASERLVDRSRRTKMAAIEDDLRGGPAPELGPPCLVERLHQGANAASRAHPPERRVSPERTPFGAEAQGLETVLHRGGEHAALAQAGHDACPDHPGPGRAGEDAEAGAGKIDRSNGSGHTL